MDAGPFHVNLPGIASIRVCDEDRVAGAGSVLIGFTAACIVVGTLVIDMADAKKSQLVWRGMGVKEIDTQAKPEKRDKSINNAVKKIFKNYPPKQKT